jgi:hypothetical protein
LIEIGIDGELAGPTQAQIDFFKSIEGKYTDVIKSITPMIEDEFRNWKPDFSISDFRKKFTPVYLRIPRCDSNVIIWEIAFETKHDENHTITMTIKDFEASELLIDG